jgi:hypothetical protein
MRNYVVGVHDIAILMMQIKQIDLVRQQAAIETAFLGQGDMEA